MDGRTDGQTYRQTDKVIAVTLRLCFAARVNYIVLLYLIIPFINILQSIFLPLYMLVALSIQGNKV